MNSKRQSVLLNDLNKIMRERSLKILERFGQVSISHVTDPKLLVILEEINKYWSDSNVHSLFRPALASFSCEAVGGTPEAAEDAGLMFTLAAAGFGIHDDILDNSSSKHLNMTIVGLHGSDSALLIGDLLIVKAWSILQDMIEKVDASKIVKVIQAYGNLSVEICEAEFMETLCRRNVDIDLDYYIGIFWRAMAETEACARIGAIMGNGQIDEIESLAEFGRRLGFMSRLADDIEDCLNLKGDLLPRIENESVPLPILYAAKSSKENYEKIKGIVNSTPDASDAKELLKCCFETEAFVYIKNIAKKNQQEAFHKLSSLRQSYAKQMLSSMMKRSYDRVVDLCI